MRYTELADEMVVKLGRMGQKVGKVRVNIKFDVKFL
jgi:hypothetical protein